VLHEHYPLGLYVMYVGDALVATLIMALILGSCRRRSLPCQLDIRRVDQSVVVAERHPEGRRTPAPRRGNLV